MKRLSKKIYMDNHATTPMDPRVLKAMMPYLKGKFGNAASGTHFFGREAAEAVERARGQTAKLINAEPREIVFTSGATESNNLALKGAAWANKDKGAHIVTVATEHKSVLDPCKRLSFEGFRVTYLPVKKDGMLDLSDLEKAISAKTILISVMLANNEIGTLQPIAEIGRIAREKGVLFHCDAAQAVGKIPVDTEALGVDLMSFNAHKIYGPKGVGALYVRKRGSQVRVLPLVDGGGHEVGLRSGTLNVPGIVGFGKACDICRREMKVESKRLEGLRNRLSQGILNGLSECVVNGGERNRLPNNLNVSFPGVRADDVIKGLGGIAVSSGSACLSTSPDSSYVLRAIGLSEDLAYSTIRFGLGRFNTQGEVDKVIRRVVSAIKRLRHTKVGHV